MWYLIETYFTVTDFDNSISGEDYKKADLFAAQLWVQDVMCPLDRMPFGHRIPRVLNAVNHPYSALIEAHKNV